MKRGESLDFGETNFQILEFGKGKRCERLRVVACRNWDEFLQHGAGESDAVSKLQAASSNCFPLFFHSFSMFRFCFIVS